MDTGARINWVLRAYKKDIIIDNNYAMYSSCDDENLLATCHLDEMLDCIKNMKYEIISYHLDDDFTNYSKISIIFYIDNKYDFIKSDSIKSNKFEKDEKNKPNLDKLIHFKVGLYSTHSIRILEDDNDTGNWEYLQK
jgi:hypothetical protein